MVCKVGEAYEMQVVIFARMVKFLELARVKGEGYTEWANIINQQSERHIWRESKPRTFDCRNFVKACTNQIDCTTK